MTEPINFHLLFTQLQSRYPTSNLISELVQVYGDRFLVRALVQLGGVTLATGMASAETIEHAEDQARLRALSLLGIATIPSLSTAPPPISPFPDPPEPPKVFLENGSFTSAVPTQSISEEAIPAVALQSSSIPPLSLEALPAPKPTIKQKSTPATYSEVHNPSDFDEEASHFQEESLLPNDDLVEESLLDRSAAFDTEEQHFNSSELDEPASTEPVDLSELIALTDVEMERIGWSKKRGQTHLKRTYEKQTRAELNEDQLMEFLHYLRALPSQKV